MDGWRDGGVYECMVSQLRRISGIGRRFKKYLRRKGRKDECGLVMALPGRRLDDKAPCKIDGVYPKATLDTPSHLKGIHATALIDSQSTIVKRMTFAAMEYLWVYKQYYANIGLWSIYPGAAAESLSVCILISSSINCLDKDNSGTDQYSVSVQSGVSRRSRLRW